MDRPAWRFFLFSYPWDTNSSLSESSSAGLPSHLLHIFYLRLSTPLHLSRLGLGEFTNDFLTNVAKGAERYLLRGLVVAAHVLIARVYLITLGEEVHVEWKWRNE